MKNSHQKQVIYFDQKLKDLFDGNITDRLNDDEFNEVLIEGKKRFEFQVPPGYKEANKTDKINQCKVNGDYIIFYDMMRISSTFDKDIVFITRDKKEDWFDKEQDRIRYELQLEFYHKTGHYIIMCDWEEFTDLHNKVSSESKISSNSKKELANISSFSNSSYFSLKSAIEELSSILKKYDKLFIVNEHIKELQKQLSDFLLELYLYANRDKISDVAFKRTLGKVAQLQLVDNCSKLYQCTLYILKQSVDLTPLSLQKLLCFIQGFSTQLLDSMLFDTHTEAWIYGPVYTEIYNCFACYKNNNIDYSEIFSSFQLELNDSEKELIDSVINSFGCYSGSMLVEMSYFTNPWVKAREGLEDSQYTSSEINYEELIEYFKNICQKYDIKDFAGISKYAEDLFLQVKKISKKII